RINPDFKRLKPVTVDLSLESKSVRIRGDEAIERRQFRRRTGSQIAKQTSAALDHRIGLVPDIAAQVAVLRLRRRLQALALDIEEPAVEGATQTAVFETSIGKIGAAMWTGPAEEPVASLLVAEDHELFPEKLHCLERPITAQFVDQGCRLPIAPQRLSCWLIGANAGDTIILFAAEHNDLSPTTKLSARLRSVTDAQRDA